MVTIKKVETKKELKQFIRFNYELYKDNQYAVPEFYEDMLNTFSPKNAAMDFCDTVYFLAYKDGKIAGRIVGIVNHKANSIWNQKNVRFGWIDFIDDEEVSKALLDAVAEWGRAKGMTQIHGPLGFTDNDPEGMLIEGFEELSTMTTIYNYPYYPQHMEKLGFEKDVDWIEMQLEAPRDGKMPERLTRMAELLMKKFDFRIKKYKSIKKLAKEYGKEIFHVLNEAFKPLFGYNELSEKQIDQYIKMYLPFIDPKLVSLVTDANGKLLAVGISIPSFSRALQKAKGKLFPFGWWHMYRALKHPTTNIVDLLLVGVLPEYQNKGVNSLLFYDLLPIYMENGFEYAETHPELEYNHKVQQQWVYFERRIHKRRRCFKKAL